jgi:hypothetical protein
MICKRNMQGSSFVREDKINLDTAMQRIVIENILIFFFSFYVFIDMINGYLLRNGFFSISLIFKTITLLFVMIYLLTNKNTIKYVVFAVGLILLYLIIHIIILSNVVLAIKGLDWMVKFLAIFIFYIFFSKLIRENKIDKVIKIIIYSFIFLCLNFTIGYLGYGYPMYGTDETSIGTRGLIYAGNEISAAVIISGAILQMYFIVQKKYVKFLLIGIMMMAMGALLTSKVSILASMLTTLFFPLIKASEKIKYFRISKTDFKFSLIILIFLPLLSSGFVYYALYVSNLMSRLSYFYEKVDIITLLFSHRNVWALEALNAFYNNYSIIEMFFGTGHNWWDFVSGNKMIEIDLLDFLMTYGIVGVVITYGFLFYIIFKSVAIKRCIYKTYVIFMIILLIGISCTAGHILSSGTSGFLIAILLSIANYKRKNLE